MTYEIRKSTTKMLECLGPAGEHIWRSKYVLWGAKLMAVPLPLKRYIL